MRTKHKVLLITLLLFVLLVIWNVFLPFYKQPYTELPPPPDETRCFSPKCHSIIKNNGNRQAILMIHGFPSCPYLYTYFADYFPNEGYDVYVPLLPGFGTDPKDLENTCFNQWYEYVRRYYLELRPKYDRIILMGHSMGGAIALKLAEEFQDSANRPDALVTISAIVDYRNFSRLFVRTLAVIKPSYWAGTQNHQDKTDGQEEWTGYSGIFPRAGLSLIAALPAIKREIPTIKIPFYAVQDKGDKTVSFSNLKTIEKLQRSDRFRAVELDMGKRDHTRHNLPMYRSVQKELASSISLFLSGDNACL